MKSQPWGEKGCPASTHRPPNDFRTRPVRVCTSAPAFTLPPSAFTLPPHRLPRPPRSNRPPAAVVIHNGLSTEKLSTSLLAALCKTFSPSRLRTRIYNISFARRPLPGSVRAAVGKRSHRCDPVSRAGVRRVGEGEGKGGRPLAQCPALSPPTALPLPAYGRITVRKGGSAPGKPRPCLCVLPAATCLRPRPRRLNWHPASAGGRENDRMAHRRTTTPTHRTPRGNDTCTIRVPRRKGAQSVVHNL